MRPWIAKTLTAAVAAPAAVAVWGGWVSLGAMTGFGPVRPLPGIWDGLQINLALALPIGVEAYAALALGVWLSGAGSARTTSFARASALAALTLGALGQVAYHLLEVAGQQVAPWWVTVLVSVLPVGVLGAAATLLHLMAEDRSATTSTAAEEHAEHAETVTGVESSSEGPEPAPSLRPGPEQPPAPVGFPAPRLVIASTPDPTPEEEVEVDPLEGLSKREKIERLLAEDPEATTGQIAARVGCAARYVRDIRAQQAA